MTGSYYVELKRAPVTGNKPKELFENSKQVIGATLSRNGGGVETGLTIEEQDKFMPIILGVDAKDASFRKQVKNYFSDFSVTVPIGEGLKLDIGKDAYDNPINVMDYIRYKFIRMDPTVGTEEKHGRELGMLYYIEDLSKVKQAKWDKNQLKKEAYKEYIKISTDEKMIDNVLRVLSEKDVASMDLKDKDLLLSDFSESIPERFIEVCKDRNLELQSLIKESLFHEVLQKQGSAILLHDEILGYDINETIIFLTNPENSVVLATIKGKVQQFRKEKKIQERKETEEVLGTKEVSSLDDIEVVDDIIEAKATSNKEEMDFIDKGAKKGK